MHAKPGPEPLQRIDQPRHRQRGDNNRPTQKMTADMEVLRQMIGREFCPKHPKQDHYRTRHQAARQDGEAKAISGA